MSSATVSLKTAQPPLAAEVRPADPAKPDAGDVAIPSCRNWPEPVDLRYFQSEIRMASEYLEISLSEPDFAQECTSRALRRYILLCGWVQSNGGDARLEQQLQCLRWRIVRASNHDDEEELTVNTKGDLMRKCG
jgi:hypothetical protein